MVSGGNTADGRVFGSPQARSTLMPQAAQSPDGGVLYLLQSHLASALPQVDKSRSQQEVMSAGDEFPERIANLVRSRELNHERKTELVIYQFGGGRAAFHSRHAQEALV